MKLAILSDIHGNLDSLEAVLAHARREGYDHLVCLGDVVGYGAEPQECIDRLREEVWNHEKAGEMVVKGNHDDAASGGDDSYFNREAQRAVRWTHEQLSPAGVDWLAALPLEKRVGDDVYLVHSSPKDPSEWNYIISIGDALEAFAKFSERVCFVGHSHVPFHVSIDPKSAEVRVEPSETVQLREGFRYLSNVGSVGQPRDGDPRAAYVMLDLEEETLERFRVDYDHRRAAEKIRAAGLPEFLADRLARGR